MTRQELLFLGLLWNPFPMFEIHVCNRKNGQLLRAFALGDTDELIVGRDETCDVQINSRSVSREHCSLEHSGGRLTLRDLESTGGTFLDGEAVSSIQIESGTEFAVGPAIIKVFDTDD